MNRAGDGSGTVMDALSVPPGTETAIARHRAQARTWLSPFRLFTVADRDALPPQLPLAGLQALLDAVPMPLLLADAGHRVLVANAAAMQCVDDAELVGRTLDALVARNTRMEDRPLQLEGCDLLMVALHDTAGDAAREREATHLRDEIAHLSRVAMLGELSGALAHELNQPLSAILINAQAAQRMLRIHPPDLTEIGDILADIVDDDRHAGEVIQRLRKWLRKEHVDHVPLSLNSIVFDALHLVRADLLHRGVDVDLELAGNLPRVCGDRIQLQQVVLNLVMNGCDAMEGLPVRVLRLRTLRGTGGRVRVEVIDRGRGIPPDVRHTMFDPFETTKPDGLGMGLAVCRSIIDTHRGRIDARDLPEGGACVAFDLPTSTP